MNRVRKRRRRSNASPAPEELFTASAAINGEQGSFSSACIADGVVPTEGQRHSSRKRAKTIFAPEQPSTSSLVNEDQDNSSTAHTVDEFLAAQEDFCLPESKRSKVEIDIVSEEHDPTSNRDKEALTVTIESPSSEHSQEDVTIVGDVQVARPEVIDLERFPTIRQGGSVVVDLTADSSFHDKNVVDLTRENSFDASMDSSPVIVCVNRIYRGEPFSQRPSCRFSSLSDGLDGVPFTLDDDIQEVENSGTSKNQDENHTNEGNLPPRKKITCPICLEDETVLKRRKRQLTSTTCGHVFCDQCIRNAVQMQNKCPTCRKKLSVRQLHPIFL